jgi:hypothetical protein
MNFGKFLHEQRASGIVNMLHHGRCEFYAEVKIKIATNEFSQIVLKGHLHKELPRVS